MSIKMNRQALVTLGFVVVLIALTAAPLGSDERQLIPAEAKNHVGETATVCGEVASTRYAVSSRGRPTFLNLDKPYPNHIFTVVIWGRSRARFGKPETEYKGKEICVTGRIGQYRGTPQIEAKGPPQITLKSEEQTDNPPTNTGNPFLVKCDEPVPEFTLGRDSNPSDSEVAALCACIWSSLNGWEKETSKLIADGKESDVSWLHMRAFPARFGQRIDDCGGMGF